MKSRQLLCTFSNIASYKDEVQKIGELYFGKNIKFFIFKNVKFETDVYITYNVEASNSPQKFPATIRIHRKKETNSLYTLNSMNRLIIEENDGIFNDNIQLNWELYRNCLILTNDVGVKIINIKLVEII